MLSLQFKVDIILAEVCDDHEVEKKHVLSYWRNPSVVRARDELAWRIRHELKWSFPRIGDYMHRDHTSVITAVKRHDALLERIECS